MYTNYYGLRLMPFENTPDPRFLFSSRSHREVLASLRYGVDNAKGFILISGDIGTGKTTIISALVKDIDQSCIIFNIVHPKWSFAEIVCYLATKLNINTQHKNNLQIMEDLQSRLAKLDDQGQSVILIFDEAHLLPESTLEYIRLLSNIEKENKKLIQIVLVGQNEIDHILEKNSLKTLKQRIVINRNLQSLDHKETKNYVNHRLRIAGATYQVFNKKALLLIWKRSQGVPRLINHICDNALLIGYASGAKIIQANVIKEVIHDMDAGRKRINAPKFLWFRELKWAGAATVFIILAAITGGYSFWFNSMDLSGKTQDKYLFQNQSKNLSKLKNSLVKATDSNLELQTPLPLEPERHLELVTPVEPNHSIATTDSNTVDKNTGTVIAPIDAVAEPEGLIGSSPPPIANVTPAKKAQKATLAKKVIKPDDNLSNIAREAYGFANDTIIDRIHMVNSGIKSVDRIYVGQTILLPRIKKENLIGMDVNGKYHIHYASFYNYADASKCVEELRNRLQKKAVLVPAKQQESKVYRVYQGYFDSYDQARKALEHLQLKYHYFMN